MQDLILQFTPEKPWRMYESMTCVPGPLICQPQSLFGMSWEDLHSRTSLQPAIFVNWYSMCFGNDKKFRKMTFGGCLLPCHKEYKSVTVPVRFTSHADHGLKV